MTARKIVKGLAARNPVLAAAAISSANRVDSALLATLEQRWLDLLAHDDLIHRIVGCSCLALASMRSPSSHPALGRVRAWTRLQQLVCWDSSARKIGAPNAIALELAERARNLPDNEYQEQERNIGQAVKELQSAGMVNMLFEQWQASPPDSSARHRFEGLLATVDKSLLNEELQRIRSGASDPAMAADAERVLAPRRAPTIGEMLLARYDQELRQYTDRMAETVTTMRSMDDRELAAGLRSTYPAVRAAAATLAAERQAPVGDVILESILRFDGDLSQVELISALVSLWDEQTAVSRLVEGSREKCWCVGSLNPDLVFQLGLGELSEAVKAEIERLGGRGNLQIRGSESDGGTSIWTLAPSWDSSQSLYQLRVSPARLEFYDCNVARRAFNALTVLPGYASLTVLQRAVEHDDPNVRTLAIRELAKRGDQGLAARLLAQLRSTTSADFIDEALDALGVLRGREALSLMNDLLVITDGEGSDVHPVWGPCPHSRGWGNAIHRTLVRLNADSDIQQTLDKALTSEALRPQGRCPQGIVKVVRGDGSRPRTACDMANDRAIAAPAAFGTIGPGPIHTHYGG